MKYQEVPEELYLNITEIPEETRNREFKPPFIWDSKKEQDLIIKEKVIKGLIALSNTPGGGDLIVGREEKNGTFPKLGLEKEQLESFPTLESIKEQINKYVTESIDFTVQESKTEEKLLLFRVEEFKLYPNLTVIDGPRERSYIKQGELYVRKMKPKYASHKPTKSEFIDIIRLSTKKLNRVIQEMGYTKNNDKKREKLEKLIKATKL